MNHTALANAAMQLVVHGAHEYLRSHSLNADETALSACCTSWCKAQLPSALNDAKEAFACHMDRVAVATFSASMIQAGIEAAKEASLVTA